MQYKPLDGISFQEKHTIFWSNFNNTNSHTGCHCFPNLKNNMVILKNNKAIVWKSWDFENINNIFEVMVVKLAPIWLFSFYNKVQASNAHQVLINLQNTIKLFVFQFLLYFFVKNTLFTRNIILYIFFTQHEKITIFLKRPSH